MRGPRFPQVLSTLALGAFALVASTSFAAGPPDPERKNTARGLADYAMELYDAGKYEEAITAFKQANDLFHAPTLVLAWARACSKARHLLAARELFKKVVDEPLPADATAEFRAAQRDAKSELAALVIAIPTLEVRLRGTMPPGGVVVTVDDKPVRPGDPTDLDPKKHAVKVTGSVEPRLRTVALTERAHEVVVIDLDAPVDDAGPSMVPGGVVLGVAGVGLLVGGIAGIVTLHNASVIKANCQPDGVCPTLDMPKVTSATAVADISTAGFVVAGVGAVVGTVLVVRAAQAKPSAPSVSAGFGLRSAFVRGSF